MARHIVDCSHSYPEFQQHYTYPNNLLTVQNCVMSSHTLLTTASLYHLDIVHGIITLSRLPVTAARRKVQTPGNCFEGFVIVEGQSH